MNNKTVDEILTSLPQYNLGNDPITDEPFTAEETYAIYPELREAKQAIEHLITEARINEVDKLNHSAGLLYFEPKEYVENRLAKLKPQGEE